MVELRHNYRRTSRLCSANEMPAPMAPSAAAMALRKPLEPFGIEELMDRDVRDLSGGELERVALCICLGKLSLQGHTNIGIKKFVPNGEKCLGNNLTRISIFTVITYVSLRCSGNTTWIMRRTLNISLTFHSWSRLSPFQYQLTWSEKVNRNACNFVRIETRIR
uniref:ABC transporter E family member 2-like isoform X2 n=1 Tax=Tanacetum cinerariifolium TaxID=118510 RepID=A0A6L2P2P0_TANCI|nr:ABC transporter E family member 2-like isoform X2 [Tanacetum cinerariifolium]